MEYVKLGATGLEVSRLCLGCMGFGDPKTWIHSWVLEEDEARPVIRKALDLGINFFDTANVYSLGRSEEIVGTVLREHGNRDELVIATKVHGRMHPGPNGEGLSRKAIMTQVDASLRRLGTDYIDLYIIHRWDYGTPIEETMAALDDVVRAGKVRYLGASAMYAWQFLSALHASDRHGWARFVSMQNHLNLLYREEEREMLPLCRAEGIAVTPYSPLAAGRLTRVGSSRRDDTDEIARAKYDATAAQDQLVIDAVARIAEAHGVPRLHVALAWLWQTTPVVAPIVGATKESHLTDAVAAIGFTLSDDEMAELEAPYVPHPVVGPI